MLLLILWDARGARDLTAAVKSIKEVGVDYDERKCEQ